MPKWNGCNDVSKKDAQILTRQLIRMGSLPLNWAQKIVWKVLFKTMLPLISQELNQDDPIIMAPPDCAQ